MTNPLLTVPFYTVYSWPSRRNEQHTHENLCLVFSAPFHSAPPPAMSQRPSTLPRLTPPNQLPQRSIIRQDT
ncbi:hypothetical protein K470DRAFT_257179 [Piedraia hortae CBS 480.64]|uniref:Uncharacterized protein n=1 Tax=Piedraia hortae CBS 480.64 TaxID=1314780 RepID=A0A6A7C1Z9_9PEZI|nr:hypothetical protein K470DRAFT_257179 [Piedraia hortae CBS 480.64]